jgi:hypothetical protein
VRWSLILLFSFSGGPHPNTYGTFSIRRLVKSGKGAAASFFK